MRHPVLQANTLVAPLIDPAPIDLTAPGHPMLAMVYKQKGVVSEYDRIANPTPKWTNLIHVDFGGGDPPRVRGSRGLFQGDQQRRLRQEVRLGAGGGQRVLRAVQQGDGRGVLPGHQVPGDSLPIRDPG